MTTSIKGVGLATRKEHCICKRVYNEKSVKQVYKNISTKMLKDVGMTVPKSRETSAVYICSKTGDEGNIYTATQGMRACNNNNMHNPSLHPSVSGYDCCMPSSPVLLHIYCTCFSTFWHCHPYIFQHFILYLYTLRVLYCRKNCRPCYVSERLITVVFGSCEPFYLG